MIIISSYTMLNKQGIELIETSYKEKIERGKK